MRPRCSSKEGAGAFSHLSPGVALLNLVSIADVLRAVVSSAAPLDVRASWIDYTGSVPTPDRDNTQVAGAGTHTIVSAPGAGVRRTIGELVIRNTDGALSNTVEVEHFDNSAAVVVSPPGVSLGPGESLVFRSGQGWTHLTSAGAIR